ncbi:MAG TPA: RNA polymerase sigma factor [Acidobacteriaceae bacterium]|jgi:RNA polymerase sigma-70 factor, ECF subfamily|nr:RNA polymerase sigma factor [Acidobacteriaceae bacterium]
MATAQRQAEAQAPSTPLRAGLEDPLVAAAVAGDTASFEMLVQRYRRIVLRIGQRITGSREDAEDIAQLTFLKLFVNISSFQGKSSFSTWLTSIAMNEARMWRRKASRCREVQPINISTDQELAPALEVSDPRPNAESAYGTVEREALLVAKLNRLRPANRVALELCDLQEQSTSATAHLLGITVSAVKSRRSRGRAELRKALAHHLSRAYQKVTIKRDKWPLNSLGAD